MAERGPEVADRALFGCQERAAGVEGPSDAVGSRLARRTRVGRKVTGKVVLWTM